MKIQVISPILSNLFLHYVFDVWMTRKHPNAPWSRYADDGICHCRTKEQAELLLLELEQRFRECKLEIHPDKTKIIYCKDSNRQNKYQGDTSFVFLGYEFRARRLQNQKTGTVFAGFLPAISPKAVKSIHQKIKSLQITRKSNLTLKEIAKRLNPMIQGWINYYGRYTKSAMNKVLKRINSILVAWSRRKYLKLRNRKVHAIKCMKNYAKKHPNLFVHWQIGIIDVFI